MPEIRTNHISVSAVSGTKDGAKRYYDRISRYYDYLTGIFERKNAEINLKQLSIGAGETVLEIGFGTGQLLVCLILF